MVAEVYADVLFLVNFIMNFFVLFIAGKILRRKTRRLRVAAGGAVSALIYCIIIFTVPLNVFGNIIFGVITLSVGVLIAYAPVAAKGLHNKIKQFFYLLLAAWAAAFLLGGAAFAVYFLVSSPYSLFGAEVGGEGFPFGLLIFSAVVVYVALKVLSHRLRKAQINRQAFYEYRVWLSGANAEITGLVDTGNCLREPISRSPVVVAEAAGLRNVLPSNINALFTENRENDMQRVLDEFTAGGLSTRIRFIPYNAANGASGVFVGFKPDKIELTTEDGVKTISDVIIGICNFKLSSDGDYNSLLNAALFDSENRGV